MTARGVLARRHAVARREWYLWSMRIGGRLIRGATAAVLASCAAGCGGEATTDGMASKDPSVGTSTATSTSTGSSTGDPTATSTDGTVYASRTATATGTGTDAGAVDADGGLQGHAPADAGHSCCDDD